MGWGGKLRQLLCTIGCNSCVKVNSLDPFMDAKLNSKTHLLKPFSFFRAVSSAFGFKVCKKCLYDPKYFFYNMSIWLWKNTEIDADFKSLKKLGRKLLEKVRRIRTFSTALQDENQQFFHFYINNFSCRIFWATFSLDLKSASNFEFFDTHLSKKNVFGV